MLVRHGRWGGGIDKEFRRIFLEDGGDDGVGLVLGFFTMSS